MVENNNSMPQICQTEIFVLESINPPQILITIICISEWCVNKVVSFAGCAQCGMQWKPSAIGTRPTGPQILGWTHVETTRQWSKCPSDDFLVKMSLLGFIFYTNPSCVNVFVFHLHYHVMHRQLPSSHGAKFRLTKAKHQCFGVAVRAYEQNNYFREGVLLVQESKLKCPPLVLIMKISCIWSHWAKNLFPLLAYLLHWDVYRIVVSTLNSFKSLKQAEGSR